jgi:hypothetical protein
MLCTYLVVIKKVAAEVEDRDTKQECNLIIERSLLRLLQKGNLDYLLAAWNNFSPRYMCLLMK